MHSSCLTLLTAASLLLCPPGWAQDPVPVLCDHKDVQAGVDLALVTHNAKLQHGHQLALYQIVAASKAGNGSTTLFNLKFLVRESDCPVGGDKEWRDCDYLPQGNRLPSPCTAVVSKSNEEEGLGIVLLECKPTVEPVVVASEAQCLGCPEEMDVDSEDLKEPVSYSLTKFNAEDGSSHHFLLREIVSARRQVVAGFKYDIQFNLEKSNCSKEDFKELTEECHPGSESFATCNSTVYIAPWRREEPEAHVHCEHGPLRMRLPMRRPPGWSPLRHYTSFAVKKAKSSEESQEAGRPPAPPATAPPAAESTPDPALLLPLPPQSEPPRPFNCPTKPWKEFVPLTLTPPPPPPPQNEDTPAPEFKLEDGLFSDLDLVG